MRTPHLYLPALIVVLVAASCNNGGKPDDLREYRWQGRAQGTTWQVTANAPSGVDYKKGIDSILIAIDLSMSTYVPTSLISKVNEGGKWTAVDEHFLHVLVTSGKIYRETGGYFDPTVGPLVDLWGFGEEEMEVEIDGEALDSVHSLTGFEEVKYRGDSVYLPPGFRLDFNAIAQGYTVDIIAAYLDSNGTGNYMVEVGGEVRTRGRNIEGRKWRIGVDKPSEKIQEERFQVILELENDALATSGNYRKFREDEKGRKFSHAIDPHTGQATRDPLLSVSVVGEDCMKADAYATALLVMGLERACDFASEKGLNAYFVYSDDKGEWAVWHSPGFEEFILE